MRKSITKIFATTQEHLQEMLTYSLVIDDKIISIPRIDIVIKFPWCNFLFSIVTLNSYKTMQWSAPFNHVSKTNISLELRPRNVISGVRRVHMGINNDKFELLIRRD